MAYFGLPFHVIMYSKNKMLSLVIHTWYEGGDIAEQYITCIISQYFPFILFNYIMILIDFPSNENKNYKKNGSILYCLCNSEIFKTYKIFTILIDGSIMAH